MAGEGAGQLSKGLGPKASSKTTQAGSAQSRDGQGTSAPAFPVLRLPRWVFCHWREEGGKLMRNQRSAREPERSHRKRFV